VTCSPEYGPRAGETGGIKGGLDVADLRVCPFISRALEPTSRPWLGLLDSRQPSSTEVPMRQLGLAVVLVLSLILSPLVVEAQQEAKVARIGWLGDRPVPVAAPPATGLLPRTA
jgi:hypothetical protein